MTEREIRYPCEWCYTVIGGNEAAMRGVIAEVLSGKEHTVLFSKKSAAGTYVSLNVTVQVESDDGRLRIYSALSTNPAIKMVL